MWSAALMEILTLKLQFPAGRVVVDPGVAWTRSE